jgi:hypothetical protein
LALLGHPVGHGADRALKQHDHQHSQQGRRPSTRARNCAAWPAGGRGPRSGISRWVLHSGQRFEDQKGVQLQAQFDAAPKGDIVASGFGGQGPLSGTPTSGTHSAVAFLTVRCRTRVAESAGPQLLRPPINNAATSCSYDQDCSDQTKS